MILHFPNDITGIEMKKSVLCKMEIPFKFLEHFLFLFNSGKIADNEILKNLYLRGGSKVIISEIHFNDIIQVTEGKRIVADIYINDIWTFSLTFGTLNQIKELHKGIYIRFGSLEAIIYPGEIEVKENDERTFSEIGIRDNFICKLKTKKK